MPQTESAPLDLSPRRVWVLFHLLGFTISEIAGIVADANHAKRSSMLRNERAHVVDRVNRWQFSFRSWASLEKNKFVLEALADRLGGIRALGVSEPFDWKTDSNLRLAEVEDALMRRVRRDVEAGTFDWSVIDTLPLPADVDARLKMLA